MAEELSGATFDIIERLAKTHPELRGHYARGTGGADINLIVAVMYNEICNLRRSRPTGAVTEEMLTRAMMAAEDTWDAMPRVAGQLPTVFQPTVFRAALDAALSEGARAGVGVTDSPNDLAWQIANECWLSTDEKTKLARRIRSALTAPRAEPVAWQDWGGAAGAIEPMYPVGVRPETMVETIDTNGKRYSARRADQVNWNIELSEDGVWVTRWRYATAIRAGKE